MRPRIVPTTRRSAAVLVLLLAALCSCGARSQPDAVVPLHWQIAYIDSVGRIPSSQFVFLSSDRVRPGPALGGVRDHAFVATLDSAIAGGVVFRQTAFLLATEYSRSQQGEFGDACRLVLGRPEMLAGLRARRTELVDLLSGRIVIPADRGGSSARVRALSANQARALAQLPLSAYFELVDAATDTSAADVGPRMLLLDLWLVSATVAGRSDVVAPEPEARLVRATLSDTTLALSARLELARRISLESSRAVERFRQPVHMDSVSFVVLDAIRPLLQRVRAHESVPSRYEWLDTWKGPDGGAN